MTFGSLFAGIGGLDLGLERAGHQCAWQVEIDPFCRKVLAKHWPDVPRYEDVRDVGSENLEPVDLICGGFPCQDISVAGGGAGLDGERSGLWDEYRRIIGEMGPAFVLVENSPALTVRGLGAILGTLSDLGYDAEWSTVSACSVGATHLRRRLFIVAHTDCLMGWTGIRALAHRAGAVLKQDNREVPRLSATARVEDASALYGGAHGLPDKLDRNRALGNAVVPQVAEWIGRRLPTEAP